MRDEALQDGVQDHQEHGIHVHEAVSSADVANAAGRGNGGNVLHGFFSWRLTQ